MKSTRYLLAAVAAIALCSCARDKPQETRKPREFTPSTQPYVEPVQRTSPTDAPFAPTRVTSPNFIPQPADSSPQPQPTDGGAAGAGGGDGAASDATTSGPGQGGEGDPGLSPTPSGSAGAGTGHLDPLGDPQDRLKALEEKLEIPAADQPPAAGDDEPLEQETPAPSTVTPEPPADLPDELPPTQLTAEQIERLPPERRAAVVRYLQAIQNRRAATQPTGGTR